MASLLGALAHSLLVESPGNKAASASGLLPPSFDLLAQAAPPVFTRASSPLR